ncbi:hypothetical protein WT55_33185 [Burkholderia pseudomultivorans]|nr:hypothetical protein WT55_33185 [Burkholderia pseudomultivorans]
MEPFSGHARIRGFSSLIGDVQQIQTSGVLMRFRRSQKPLVKYLMYGIYPDRFSTEYGDGWFAVLLGAFGRTLPMSVGIAALSCVVAPGALTAGGLAFTTAILFGYNAFLERHLIRRSRREET